MAQLTTATMVGSVTDSTGAVIPRATITVTQTDTNFTRTVTAKDDGSFRDEFLPVGPYKISVSAPGFKTLERTGVVLAVMQEADLTFQLQNGETTETVNVSSGAPLINLSNATIGRTISNVEIENLPLVGRDTYQLLSLTPGVQSNSVQNSLGFKEQHVYINGSTDDFTGQVSYYLDGGLNMTGLRNSGNAIPTPDAISQFHVETNNFSASLGRYAAAVVSLVTKDGTNQFHGSAFEFYRTKNFTAVSHNQITKQPYARNEYGATFGGPIRKDKDFFFAASAACVPLPLRHSLVMFRTRPNLAATSAKTCRQRPNRQIAQPAHQAQPAKRSTSSSATLRQTHPTRTTSLPILSIRQRSRL